MGLILILDLADQVQTSLRVVQNLWTLWKTSTPVTEQFWSRTPDPLHIQMFLLLDVLPWEISHLSYFNNFWYLILEKYYSSSSESFQSQINKTFCTSPSLRGYWRCWKHALWPAEQKCIQFDHISRFQFCYTAGKMDCHSFNVQYCPDNKLNPLTFPRRRGVK